jgi:hypothetical protein
MKAQGIFGFHISFGFRISSAPKAPNMKAQGIALGNEVFITPAPTGRNNSARHSPINPTRIVRQIRLRVSLKIGVVHPETIVCRDVLFDWQCNSSPLQHWIG